MQTEKITKYKDFIRRSLDEWKTLDDEDIQMDKFYSYCNIVYKATATKDVQPKTVVFKKFLNSVCGMSKESMGFLSVEAESLICKEVTKRGFGPKMLVNTEEYRISEYINAQKIEYSDLKKIEIRRWHVLAVANFNKVQVKGFNKKKVSCDSEAVFSKYLQDIDGMFASPKFSAQDLEIINPAKNIISQENKEFLRKVIPKNEEEFVLCQGDQNFHNVLVNKENGQVTLVDYEVASYSFKGDDIGGLIFYSIMDIFYPEAPYLKLYEENYPSDELFRELAEYYVVFFDMDDETMKAQSEKMVLDKNLLDEYVKEKYQKEEFEAQVQKMIQRFKIGICSAALWLIRQAVSADPPQHPGMLMIQASYKLFLRVKENF